MGSLLLLSVILCSGIAHCAIMTAVVTKDLSMVISSSFTKMKPAANSLSVPSQQLRVLKIQQLRRQVIAPVCDYILAPPIRPAALMHDLLDPVKMENTIITNLGDGRVFFHDPATGQYVARDCEDMSALYDPCPVYASGVDLALQKNVSIFFAGPGRIIFHDYASENGTYSMMAFDADVHGAGNLFRQASGAIFPSSLGKAGAVDLVYLADESAEYMAVVDKASGDVTVRLYNSTARNSDKLFGRVVAATHVDLTHTTVSSTYGALDMIVYDTVTGAFQVHTLVKNEAESKSYSHKLKVATQGHLTESTPCSAMRSQQECLATPTCGWCVALDKCTQVTGLRRGDTMQRCDGNFCKMPSPQKLQPAYRYPEIFMPVSKNRTQGNTFLDEVVVTPSMPPGARELLIGNDLADYSSRDMTNEITVVSTATEVGPDDMVAGGKIPSYFFPPRSDAVACMNGESNMTLCNRKENVVRGPSTVAPDHVHSGVKPWDREDNPSQPENSRDPLESMPPSYMNDVYDDHGSGTGMSLRDYDKLHLHAMEDGALADNCNDHVEPGVVIDSVSSDSMQAAMSNAQNFHPIPKIGGGDLTHSGLHVGGYSLSPSTTPVPSITPSSSASLTRTPSRTPSTTTSPSAHIHPCPERGVLVGDTLVCGRCESYVWSPSNPTTHLRPLTSDLSSCDQEGPQPRKLGAYLAQCNAAGAFEPRQCHVSTGYCWCVDMDGHELPNTRSRGTVTCGSMTPCLVKKASTKPLLGAFIPQCNPDGSYSRKQCHGSTGHCWCVNANGQEIPSTRIRGSPACDSIATPPPLSSCQEKLAAAQSRLGSYRPQCDENGEYFPRQCHGSTGHCWCVDSNGNEVHGSRVHAPSVPVCFPVTPCQLLRDGAYAAIAGPPQLSPPPLAPMLRSQLLMELAQSSQPGPSTVGVEAAPQIPPEIIELSRQAEAPPAIPTEKK